MEIQAQKTQDMNTRQARQTAYKIWIGDLSKGEMSFSDDRFNFVSFMDKRISRINIIANVVDKFISDAKPYMAFTLDDGTGAIRAKFFEISDKLKSINIGNTILVIGWLRFFNNEIYISPEIIKIADERWLLVRKLELESEYGKRNEAEENFDENPKLVAKTEKVRIQPVSNEKIKPLAEEIIENEMQNTDTSETSEVSADNPVPTIKNDVLNFVKKNEEGVDIDNLIMSVNSPVASINSAISELIEEGLVYEPQPGRLRVI